MLNRIEWCVAAICSICFISKVLSEGNDKIKNDILRIAFKLEEKYLSADHNPCENFYDFVCEREFRNSSISFDENSQELLLSMTQLLKPSQNRTKAQIATKNFFMSCREARNISDLQSTLMYRMSGGWPAIESSGAPIFKNKTGRWLDVLTAFHGVGGTPYLFQHSAEIKSNRRVVELKPSPQENYDLNRYEELVNQVLNAYNVDAAKSRLIALETLQFEQERRVIFNRNDSNTLHYKSDNYTNLRTAIWDNYFKKVLGKPLKPNDIVRLVDYEIFEKLEQLLENTTLTRLLNWIWIDYLMDKQKENCENLTTNYFESVFEYTSQQSIFNNHDMASMYSEIMTIMKQNLSDSLYFDEHTLQKSKLFASSIMGMALYDKKAFDYNYANLVLGRKNFFANLEKVQRFLQKQEHQLHSKFSIACTICDQISDYKNHSTALNVLFGIRKLTSPLNYIFSAEKFIHTIISIGNLSKIMDGGNNKTLCLKEMMHKDENQMYSFVQLYRAICSALGSKLFENWILRNSELASQIDNLLSLGSLKLSLRKLYFIGSTIINDCPYTEHENFIQNILPNSEKFTKTFGCHKENSLFSTKACKLF